MNFKINNVGNMMDITYKQNNIINILIVDDTSACRNMTRKSLLLSGHEYDLEIFCDEAPEGKSAVEMVYHHMNDSNDFQRDTDILKAKKTVKTNCQAVYDVILMDYQMPTMDGPTAIREIRALGYKGTIIGSTGNALSDDMEVMRDAGADDVFPKPVKAELLEDMLLNVYNEKNKDTN